MCRGLCRLWVKSASPDGGYQAFLSPGISLPAIVMTMETAIRVFPHILALTTYKSDLISPHDSHGENLVGGH